ncbi:hypothetical protein FA13DRAFT_1737436 [Coprinellus micaceus]|uniref:Uncharacterized protein n=1 Tax=Coprinellus micaceus TaxID=71717 RepID=A0A4Y7SXB6_COPMI|nr:hypothetical protein FA13DRAFT_1737436 [Coprinellus micaceus]
MFPKPKDVALTIDPLATTFSHLVRITRRIHPFQDLTSPDWFSSTSSSLQRLHCLLALPARYSELSRAFQTELASEFMKHTADHMESPGLSVHPQNPLPFTILQR